MVKRTLVRGRGRKFGGSMFYEMGSFITKKSAKVAAQRWREPPHYHNARVVKVKKAVLHLDKRNYPWHLFVSSDHKESLHGAYTIRKRRS